MYAPRAVPRVLLHVAVVLALLYSVFRMSEQAAHAAGPPGPAALPQHQPSSQLGQSPQLPCRTASFHDDGCVASRSTSNSVAASKSETIPDGRHPIHDGGALTPKVPDDPAAIGHFRLLSRRHDEAATVLDKVVGKPHGVADEHQWKERDSDDAAADGLRFRILRPAASGTG